MSARKLLRIVLSIVVLALLGLRLMQQWRYESRWWLAGTLTLAVLLLALLIYLVASAFRKPRKLRDEVPKHPLGLE
jgi:ABC-type phosphate transport system permease subunit